MSPSEPSTGMGSLIFCSCRFEFETLFPRLPDAVRILSFARLQTFTQNKMLSVVNTTLRLAEQGQKKSTACLYSFLAQACRNQCIPRNHHTLVARSTAFVAIHTLTTLRTSERNLTGKDTSISLFLSDDSVTCNKCSQSRIDWKQVGKHDALSSHTPE